MDTTVLGERTVTIDCDVLQADGGTRCASITGGYLALVLALRKAGLERAIVSKIAAISVGIVADTPLLDLEYTEDSGAEVDFNVVGTDAGTYVEVQGTAEGKPFDRCPDGPAPGARRRRPAEALHHPGRGPGGAQRDRASVAERRPARLATLRHKVRELQELLDLPGLTLLTPDDLGIEGEPVEDADTFAGNAEIKARFYAERSGLPTLADDSGLEVDALGGRPGVYTRRYAGPDATDVQNNALLLEELDGVPAERRTARYHCVLAFLDPAAGPETAPVFSHGTFEGRIADHAPGQRRLRLRPHLRAGIGGPGRPHGGPDERRGEARPVAPGQGRPRHGRASARGGLVGGRSVTSGTRAAARRCPSPAPCRRRG